MNEEAYIQTLRTIVADQRVLSGIYRGTEQPGPLGYYVLAIMSTGLQFMSGIKPPEEHSSLHEQFLSMVQLGVVCLAKELDGNSDPDLEEDFQSKSAAFMESLRQATAE